MESTARISIDSISQLLLYKADRSVIMEAFRDRFIAAELLSYKELLFEEATEEWYAQRDPIEVDWVESECIRQAEQFARLIKYQVSSIKYLFSQQVITFVLGQAS